MAAQPANRSRGSFALLIQAALACGCASTASLPRLEPAENELAGVRRIAVLPVAGPPDDAAAAQQALLDTLNQAGRFRLIGAAELQLTGPQPLYYPDGRLDRPAVLEAARRSRADAILLARLEVQEQAGAGFAGVPLLSGESTVRVTCHLELIDVRSGQTLFRDAAAESFSGGLSSTAGHANSRGQVSRRLASSSATAAARKITPHHTRSDVPLVQTSLGQNQAAMRRGNALAIEGRWSEALRQWRNALAQDPQNDGAMYSIGLAFEAQGDYARAEQWYSAALARSETSQYRQALDRARSAAGEYRVAQGQIQAAREILPPSAAWREPWSDHPYGATTSLASGWRSAPAQWRTSGYEVLAEAAQPAESSQARADFHRLPPAADLQLQESRLPHTAGQPPLQR